MPVDRLVCPGEDLPGPRIPTRHLRLQAHLDWQQTELDQLNRELQEWLKVYPTWFGQTRLLRSVPGAGPTVVAVVTVLIHSRSCTCAVVVRDPFRSNYFWIEFLGLPIVPN